MSSISEARAHLAPRSFLQMVNASALDLAKAALASGASPEQVALMMHQSGASQGEMSQVQKAVQDHMRNKGEREVEPQPQST